MASPPISVVIASLVGPPFIDQCLKSLESEAQSIGAEVIVVACGDSEYAARIARLFPWVRVVHRPERETVPELRRAGVDEARAGIVAVIEEHCVAAPDWLRQALTAHASGDYGVVGGPVLDHNYDRLRDWVVYFCEYNGYFPPVVDGETDNLGSANIAYRRSVLLEERDLLGSGYWEASLHPVLLAKGVKFRSVSGMIVRHCGPFNFRYYLRQRYLFSRAFAGHRARHLPLAKRAAYIVAAPAVPFLLFARMSARVWAKRCNRARFAQTIPLLMPALTIYVAGEWVGYIAGPGAALYQVE